MRSLPAALVGVAAAAALVLVAAVPAQAAPDPDVDSTVTVQVISGSLALTVPVTTTALSATTPGQPASGSITGLQVDDTRAVAGDWEVSYEITDFVSTSPAGTISSATYFTYDGLDWTSRSGSAAFTPAGVTQGASGPSGSATVVGNNMVTWNADLELLIPHSALAADYTATLTHSIL